MKLIPEWEAHDKCLMAWPCNKNLYNEIIKDARLEMANLANCISDKINQIFSFFVLIFAASLAKFRLSSN